MHMYIGNSLEAPGVEQQLSKVLHIYWITDSVGNSPTSQHHVTVYWKQIQTISSTLGTWWVGSGAMADLVLQTIV